MKTRQFLSAEVILKYLIGKNDKIDTMILCKPASVELLTTDYNLHEALGSIKNRECFEINKLIKFLESVKVVSYENVHRKPKPVLTEKRVEELQKSLEGKKQISNPKN